MISASLVVEGHGPPYMTYPPEHYGPPPKAEFARPLPKARYNGDPVVSMGRIVQGGPVSRMKYETSSPGPVNLVQPKDEPSRMFSQTHHSHYSYLSPNVSYPAMPYHNYHMPTALFRPGFIAPHPAVNSQSLPPPPVAPAPVPARVSMEQYSPPQTATTTTTPSHGFLSPNDTHQVSPTALPGQSILKRQPNNFKVPSGKEGSLKHRILRTPSGAVVKGKTRLSPTNHSTPGSSNSIMHPPPASPSLPINSHGPIPSRSHTNNNTIYSGFNKGSHIQLSNGEMRRVEEMRTEDFVQSAENDPELRLADSTVVRIHENGQSVTLTLSYNQHRSRANFEASIEHPFFVYGQGWASCKPDLTLQHYGLKCNRLQVGDICISLTPREKPLPPKTPTNTSISHSHRSRDLPQNLSMHQPNHLYNSHHDRSHSSATILTTATTTAMTARPTSTIHSNSMSVGFTPGPPRLLGPPGPQQIPQLNRALSADACSESNSSKKRRWSAPDNISDDPTQPVSKKHKE